MYTAVKGGLVFEEPLNLSKSGWFAAFNYTIYNVLDSSDNLSFALSVRRSMISGGIPGLLIVA
jgi:hypothetical protein